MVAVIAHGEATQDVNDLFDACFAVVVDVQKGEFAEFSLAGKAAQGVNRIGQAKRRRALGYPPEQEKGKQQEDDNGGQAGSFGEFHTRPSEKNF